MTPSLDILFDFLECDGDSVQLGDNRECKIKDIGKVKVQLKDVSSFVLHNVRIKMRTLLIQHRCEAALEVLPADMEAQTKAELNKKAHSAMILCLGNKVLREVTGETTAARVWSKLETLYHHTNTLCGYLALWMGSFDLGGHKQLSSSGSTYDDSEVMMVMSAHVQDLLDWIMDSGYSYYMTPSLDILFDFLECDGDGVQLGDNRECKIKDIGKVKVQLKDVSSFVLHNVREAGLQVLEKQELFGKKSLDEEMDCLRKNKTWELVDHPVRQKLVSCKWLFKIKEGIESVQKP
nr:zinc finger, CCHC-type [Tanacetum cinerariifolium]